MRILSIAILVPLVLAACAAPAAPIGSTQNTGGSTETVAGAQATPVEPAIGTEATVTTAVDATLGTILTDTNGMTLYRYTRDEQNVSNCSGKCAENWPPLIVPSGTTPALAVGVAGSLGTITRDDGTNQVTYNGMPLYYYAKDSTSGDTYGQGVGGVWFVVQPAAM